MELIIGLASLFIFLYRTLFLMIPMFMESYKKELQSYVKIINLISLNQ